MDHPGQMKRILKVQIEVPSGRVDGNPWMIDPSCRMMFPAFHILLLLLEVLLLALLFPMILPTFQMALLLTTNSPEVSLLTLVSRMNPPLPHGIILVIFTVITMMNLSSMMTILLLASFTTFGVIARPLVRVMARSNDAVRPGCKPFYPTLHTNHAPPHPSTFFKLSLVFAKEYHSWQCLISPFL
jgi:hypothetical protein